MSQIGGAGDAQRVIGIRNGEDQRRDPKGGEQYMDNETQHDAAERDEPRGSPLADRTRDEIGHVWAGGQRHADGDGSEGGKIGEMGHAPCTVVPAKYNEVRPTCRLSRGC